MPESTVYLSLGSNLGDRHRSITEAIELLSNRVHVEKVSSIYETDPVGYDHQSRFLNAVCKARTSMEPSEVLTLAKEIESTLGREITFRNGPRTIDIDILFYDDQVINTPQLTVPHPRLEERSFVLVPLGELEPGLVHPTSGKSITELMSGMTLDGIERWKGEGKDV
jgi:2-amino-4-hydroxy-6-hydroxymethyldihydropteridine diphosphokinase